MSLALALTLAAVATTAPAAAPPAAPAWLQVIVHESPGVPALWQQLQWRHANRRIDGSFPSDGGKPPDLHFDPARARLVEADGPFVGMWTFLAPPAADRPNAAYRLREKTGATYGIEADLHCEVGAGCKQARAALARLRAPAPADSGQRKDWIDIVSTEACEPGPKDMPPPDYPARALRYEGSGRVVLRLLINRCGDVRDVHVHETSGDRELDRASVLAARSWRTPPAPDGAAIATLRVPLRFDLQPYPATDPAD